MRNECFLLLKSFWLMVGTSGRGRAQRSPVPQAGGLGRCEVANVG